MAPWRTAVLVLIHLAIAGHLLHWCLSGRSLGRVVLSDSMQTLELGEVNPGFILFGLALVTTAVLGRFLCGWACHMGALQDLSAWVLRRLGIRPHVFRSRLLGYFPLALALYMFAWPTFYRSIAVPAARSIAPSAASGLIAPPFPGWSAQWTSARLWDGLPTLWVAVPFLLICGCATVYFLGARGLCRYGCPYGGFLLAAEPCAPLRVAVDATRCDHCGLCTAACTAGVRVHDEVRALGAVLDRNCVKSLDCVSVCPQNALALRLTMPPLFRKRPGAKLGKRRWDLTIFEEVVCASIACAAFVTLRGLYDLIPMLLAGTIGILAAFWVGKLLQMRRNPSVRFAGRQIRLHRRVTGSGWAFIGLSAILAGLLGQSAFVRFSIWRAEQLDNQVTVSFSGAMSGAEVSAAQRETAAQAIRWYVRATSITRGGCGLARTPAADLRIAWLWIVLGKPGNAVEVLASLCDAERGADRTGVELARLLVAMDRRADAEAALSRLSADNPAWYEVHEMLHSMWLHDGCADKAAAHGRLLVESRPHDARLRVVYAHTLAAGGQPDEAIRESGVAARTAPEDPAVRSRHAMILFELGHLEEALEELRSAAVTRPAARAGLYALGASMLRREGLFERVANWESEGRAG